MEEKKARARAKARVAKVAVRMQRFAAEDAKRDFVARS